MKMTKKLTLAGALCVWSLAITAYATASVEKPYSTHHQLKVTAPDDGGCDDGDADDGGE